VPTDPLPRLLEQLTQAQRRLRSGRGWVALAEDAGVVGLVRNLEVTWGEGSGWHPHSHALLFTRRRLKVEHVQSLKKRWMGAVEAWGGYASYWHGLKVTDDPQDVDGYLSKADAELAEAEGRAPVRGWGASEELVYSHSKKGRTEGRLTAWGLLAMAAEAETEEECNTWLGRFGLYASAFHGRRQLVWSRGLRQFLQIGAELEDEDVASLEGEGEVLHVFTALEWRAVTQHRAGPAVLDAAEEHGRSGVVRVVGWLLELLRDARPDLFETWCDNGAAA
jgi:hypothetical protein